MKKSGVLTIATLLIAGLFAFTSCDQTTSTELEESFQSVKQVTPIPGAQNVTMDLKRGNGDQSSFFSVTLDGKEMEGWCIEWNENASFGVNEGTKMFTTKGQAAWEELNYFMHIKNKLRAEDPELTYREIQVVIWSLIENPSFDVDKISTYENISERIYKDGQPLFDVQKVKDIVNTVKTNFTALKAKSEDYTVPGTISLIQNDGQTIMVAAETAFAVKTKVVDGQKVVDSSVSKCFDETVSATFPNWGWTNKISENSGDVSFDIYAGAGQCDLNKGTLVGELIANYSGGTLTVTYKMTKTSPYTGELYKMATAHLYAGSEEYPEKDGGGYTVAPGQYTIVDDPIDPLSTEETYTITGLSGPIYFIAHTDVYGFDPEAS